MSLWDEPKRARHHYVDAIIKKSPENRVIWVNRPYYSSDKSFFKGAQEISDQLTVLHLGLSVLPNYLPRTLEEVFNLDKNNKKRFIFSFLSDRGISSAVTICFDYKGLSILKGLFRDSPKYYFCNDFFGFIPRLLFQKKISRYATGVIVTDPRLKEFFLKYNRRVLFLPHGLYYYENIEYRKNSKLKKLVYSGTLNFSLDYLFLLELVKCLDLELHLIGPIVEIDLKSRRNLDILLSYRRVKHYGNIEKVADRNSIIEECDICLLPYKKSFNGFALKYFDYLHMGKPIFSTDYNSCWPLGYDKFIAFYDDRNDLLKQLTKLFDIHSEARFEQMRLLASESTWDFRVKALNQFIDEN